MNTDLKEFKESLKNRVIYFEFKKKDRTVRKAYGTTNEDILNSYILNQEVSTRKYTPNENVTKFFDTENKGWRSFTNDNFIGFL